MSLNWSAQYGTYLYSQRVKHHQCRVPILPDLLAQYWICDIDNSVWADGRIFNQNEAIRLQICIEEITSFLRAHMDSAKNYSIIYLIGIGVGFSLTSWVIYKVYSTSRSHDRRRRRASKQPKTDDRTTNSDSSSHSPISDQSRMGNSQGVSAGIHIEDIDKGPQAETPGVRHRNGLRNNNDYNLISAEIQEKDSGAYICRTAYTVEPVNLNRLRERDKDSSHTPSEVEQLHAQTDFSTAVIMNDSGYLELENAIPLEREESCLAQRGTGEDTSKTCVMGKDAHSVRSIGSSISDQLMHDLGSDCSSLSSCVELQDLAMEEDILCVEIDHDHDATLINAETASTKTLHGSIALSSDDQGDSSTTTTVTTDTEQQSVPSPPLRSSTNSRASDTKDSWTDSSEFWRELDELSSPFSLPSPRHPQALRLSMENLSSSGHSSPLFIAKPIHSSTSSLASLDNDIEANCSTEQTGDEIEAIETELIEIKQEICELEEKLDQLMSIDTTQLYFNVDNMKKLTEVVLGSEDIELTSSEIAKAFHILRKYRYTFTTPEKVQPEPPMSSNEAEGRISLNNSHNKSLPYLDLADGSVTKSHQTKNVFQKSPPLSASSPLQITDNLNDLSVAPPVAEEWDIKSYCQTQPLLQQGYEELSEEYGFTTACLLKIEQNSFEGAVFMSVIIHNETGYLRSINTDSLYQKLEEMVQGDHSYMQAWNFRGLTVSEDKKLPTMTLCLKTLITQTERLADIEDSAERTADLLNLFNVTNSIRSLIIEGVKLLVCIRVNDLYTKYVSGEDFPLYTWLLFARESSTNPRSYFQNHLQSQTNCIPDQIDIKLLADTLNIDLQTFRPVKAGRGDFMSTSSQDCMDLDSHSNLVPVAIHSSNSYAVLY